MICPRCDENLLRKERTDNRCSKCRAKFAFDPKTNRLGLNDLRVRRLVDGLTGGGQFVYTAEQFRWACDRKRLRAAVATEGIGCAFVAVVVGTGLVLLGTAVGGAAVALA
nr:hypothetical protein [Micromonospora sp. DSM 115978]